MKAISLLIKPASGRCNLACKYCFYNDVAKKRDTRDFGLMSDETLETIVKRAMALDLEAVTFVFQGGEPTLIGLDFYEKLIIWIELYNKSKIKVSYAIQTNAILIDEEWAAFFHEHGFLVGVSLDGNAQVHDLNRVDPKGEGTYKQVMRAIRYLERFGVAYNILTVVTKRGAKHIDKIYTALKKEGFDYLQFIPCLDELGMQPGQNPYSLTAQDYGFFLDRLFGAWYEDLKAGRQVSIRMFDNLVTMAMGYPPESCDMEEGCTANLVIESDGSAYPCDFYVLDQWRMGNITDTGLLDMVLGETARRFVDESKKMLIHCHDCEFYWICRGGCRRHAVEERQMFCEAYQYFYEKNLDKIRGIARALRTV